MSPPDLHPYAACFQVRYDCPVEAERNRQLLQELLERIALSCSTTGAALIGHIKAYASQPGAGYLLASLTAFEAPVQVEANELCISDRLELRLAVLVYGLESEYLAQIVAEAWQGLITEGMLYSVDQQPDPCPQLSEQNSDRLRR